MSFSHQQKTQSPVRKTLMMGGVIILLSIIGFYINQSVQSYLGQQAINNTGLNVLTLQDAFDEAKRSNKLVLADMSAIWCPSCRKLDNQVFANDQVQTQLNKDFVFARVEYDSPEGDRFMQQYKVSGFPTLLVLNAQAEKLVQLPVSFQPEPFIATLKKVIDASH